MGKSGVTGLSLPQFLALQALLGNCPLSIGTDLFRHRILYKCHMLFNRSPCGYRISGLNGIVDGPMLIKQIVTHALVSKHHLRIAENAAC